MRLLVLIFVFLIVENLHSQEKKYLSEYVKAVYLLRFAENVEWNEAHNSSVKIALFDVDSTLIRGLYSLAKIRFSENRNNFV